MEIFVKIIKKVINIVMTLILVVGILFVLLYIIGIEPFVVISGSMEPSISTGSLCFVNKRVSYSSIKKDDVIAYKTPSGANVTHRVINITNDGLETKGDKNTLSDGVSTNENNYIGKNILSIPKLGYAVKLTQTPRGKIIIITFAIVIFLGSILMDDSKRKTRIEA